VDIGSLSSASQIGSLSQNPQAALSQFKAQSGSQLLSLIPAPPSSPGLGLNLDIYAAVGMQAQGVLAGGRTAIEIANISLGIDMRKSPVLPGDEDPDGTESGSASSSGGSTDSSEPQSSAMGTAPAKPAAQGNAILDKILQEDGFVAPAPDPYVVQTDFFARQGPNAPPANNGLGGSINSLA
jgi:hypothetical protein